MDPAGTAAFIQRRGRTVVVKRAGVTPDAIVKAKVLHGTPETLAGDRELARHLLTFAAADPGWASWPVPPIAGDHVVFDGRTHLIDGAKTPSDGEDQMLHVVTTIG